MREEFDLQLLQLRRLEDDVLVAFELVALDDLAALDLLARLGIDRLERDPIAGRGIELIELDALDLRRRGHQPDGAGDQREAQMTVPAWTHRDFLRVGGRPINGFCGCRLLGHVARANSTSGLQSSQRYMGYASKS